MKTLSRDIVVTAVGCGVAVPMRTKRPAAQPQMDALAETEFSSLLPRIKAGLGDDLAPDLDSIETSAREGLLGCGTKSLRPEFLNRILPSGLGPSVNPLKSSQTLRKRTGLRSIHSNLRVKNRHSTKINILWMQLQRNKLSHKHVVVHISKIDRRVLKMS